MATPQDIPALLASKDGYADLSDDAKHRLHTMVGDVEEVVGVEHLIDALQHGTSHGGDGVLRCYVGFEPSGKAHIGWKVLALQLRRMLGLRKIHQRLKPIGVGSNSTILKKMFEKDC